MSIYDQDPDTGLPRDPPELTLVPGDQVTAQRETAARARRNRAHVRALMREREPELARIIEYALITI